MSELKHDLQSLVDHPGWQSFVQHVQGEWGAGGTRFESTLNSFADSRDEDAHVLQQIRQIAVARREILRLLSWPGEEMQRLKNLEQKPEEPIRPALAAALVGQSRRGGL